MTKEELALIFLESSRAFPSHKFDQSAIAYWLRLFANVNATAFRNALDSAVLNSASGFFPVPGQVLAALRTQLDRGDPEVDWATLVGFAKTGRRGRFVESQLTARCAYATRAAGYDRIRLADIERDLPHVKRAFFAAWKSFDDREHLRNPAPAQLEARNALALIQSHTILPGVDR